MLLTPSKLERLRRTKPTGRNRLQTAMTLAGVTQMQVAEAVGTDQSRISKIKRGDYGQAGLPVEVARRLASAFGCAIDDLFPAERRGKAAA